jgi:hypothetical protein
MPKRTTEFQRVVTLVRKHTAAGTEVTPSKFLLDSDGTEHEVDICIESQVDGIRVTISIECTEQKRPADDGWVNEMKGKHDRLPTDILILYSRSGFTRGAKAAAKDFRKRLVALENLDDTSAETLFGGAKTLIFKTSAQTVTDTKIGVAASGNLPARQVDLFRHTTIFDHAGHPLATGEVLVNQILHSPKAISEYLRIGQEHHTKFSLHAPSVSEGAGNPIYYRSDNNSALQLIESLIISGTISVQTTPFMLNHGKLEDTTVAWGTVPYEGKQALIVASQDKTGNTKASFDTGERSVELQRPTE